MDEGCDFVGVPLLENLEKEQRVKVWYNSAGGDENRALKLEKLPDLGC
ncbi:MAG: hypothetical protein ABFR63_07985 [Thermodesulfobacteriota bacterium]